MCACESGYTGDECEWSICYGHASNDTAIVCSGYGDCMSPNTCVCSEGHDGPNCQLYDCFGTLSNETSACSTHGACTFVDQCQCTSGYAGEVCQWPICFGVLSNDTDNVCSSYGNCTSPDVCVCEAGHDGTNCELFDCFGTLSNEPSVCAGHGACTFVNQCECSNGYVGTECQLIDCFGFLSNDTASVCSGFGDCVAPDSCSCDSGYQGYQCQNIECFAFLSNDTMRVCSGFGSCIAPDSCSCNPHHYGSQCQVTECFGFLSNDTANVCSNHGSCVSFETCSCLSNYFGQECNIPQCYGILSNNSQVCSSRGMCSAPNDCDCSTGYVGIECELVDCFGILSNDSSVCTGHGDCLLPSNCSCNVNYWSNECDAWSCFGVLRTNDSCSKHGTCDAHDSCSCSAGYSDLNCDRFDCFGIANTNPSVCSSHGMCEALDDCTCLSNYSGPSCGTHFCNGMRNDDASVCSSHGSCMAHDSCSCETGYFGDNCDLFECFGILYSNNETVCNTEGDCVAPDACICKNNSLFYGPMCSNFSCYAIDSSSGSVCNSHGACLTHNTCNCTTGWIGEECQYAICFGLNSTDPNVCFGNGDCVDVDTCNCNYGFAPPSCEDFGNFCFNISALMEPDLVCSSHGECVGHDNCTCSEGYFEEDCSLWTCNHTLFGDSSVCSSHGQCSSYDNCSCATGFYGDVCESFDCFSIHYSDTSVCAAHGSCQQPDACACQLGYESPDCSTWKCFGVDSQSDSVCSFKGECVEPDSCRCLDGYSGSTCSDWAISVEPSEGFALQTSFRILFPPDVDSSIIQINATFIHPFTSQRVSPVMDPFQKNYFSMDVEGSSLLSHQVLLSLDIQMANISFSITRTITVLPVSDYCNADISSPVCSPVLSNFSSYNLQDSSTTSVDQLLRVIEAPVDAFYDCNGWKFTSNGDCPTQSVVYSKVSCQFPSSTFGFCQTASKSCNCHPSYTGLDCSIPKSDLPGMQSFQLDTISHLNSLLSRISSSEEYIRRDLLITKCVVNDLHDITFSLLDATLTHLTLLFNEVSASNGAAMISNSEPLFDVGSIILDMLYKKNFMVAQEKILLIPRMSKVIHDVAKYNFDFVTQGLVSSLVSPRISAHLLDDLQSSLSNREIEHEGFKLVLPSESVAPTLPRIRVSLIIFSYDLYAYNSPLSNISSGTYSVKFFDTLGNDLIVQNLASENEIQLHIPGEWDLSVTHELGYNTDTCRFWDNGILVWSTEGCLLTDLTETSATCSCNHATDFGLTTINIFDIPPIPGQFDWMLLAIIGGSSLAALISLCCLCCLACCMCLCCALMVASARHLRKLKIPKLNRGSKRRSGTDLDIYEPEVDENSGSKLLPHQDWHSLDSIGGPYRPSPMDDDTSLIPELRDQLRLLGSSQNPEEVKKLKEKLAELKDKHRRRKELDEMKTHMTSLMGLKPLADDEAEKHMKQLERSIKPSDRSQQQKRTPQRQRRMRSPKSGKNIRFSPAPDSVYESSPESPYPEAEEAEISRVPCRYRPEVDIQNPVVKEQLEDYRREKNMRARQNRDSEKEFQRWEQQFELEPVPENHHIERIEKQINRNNEQISELQKEARCFTSPKDPRRQHTSEAIIKLKFQNKMLQKKIHEYAQKYGQNPDRLRLKRQIDNLRKQYHNNKELISNLELQLDSEVSRVAASPLKSKSPAITRLTHQIEKIETDNSLLIKKGNNLMSEYFELNRRHREWKPSSPEASSPVRSPKRAADDFYRSFSSQSVHEEQFQRPPQRTAPTAPVTERDPPRKSSQDNDAPTKKTPSWEDHILASDTKTSALFSDYSTSNLTEVSRSIRDKLERLKNRIAETRRKFKENKFQIDRIKSSANADERAISKLELENQLLVANIARLAKKYRELSNQIKKRRDQ